MEDLISEKIIEKFEESEKRCFEKRIKYLSKLPLEKRWNAAKHFIWLLGITPSRDCRLLGCTCRHRKEDGFCLYEATIFGGTVKKLEEELKKNYPKLDINGFGVQFFMRQIAMNAVRLMRANAYECSEGPTIYKISSKQYENPISEYTRRLINQTIKLLRGLGLSPSQLFEKEAWTISKNLERIVAKMKIKPSEVQMERTVTTMEKKPTNKVMTS